MPLDWSEIEQGHHLQLIEAGAAMCARHAKALAFRPCYDTLAEEHLRQCEIALRRALITVRRAQAIYRKKAVNA